MKRMMKKRQTIFHIVKDMPIIAQREFVATNFNFDGSAMSSIHWPCSLNEVRAGLRVATGIPEAESIVEHHTYALSVSTCPPCSRFENKGSHSSVSAIVWL